MVAVVEYFFSVLILGMYKCVYICFTLIILLSYKIRLNLYWHLNITNNIKNRGLYKNNCTIMCEF